MLNGPRVCGAFSCIFVGVEWRRIGSVLFTAGSAFLVIFMLPSRDNAAGVGFGSDLGDSASGDTRSSSEEKESRCNLSGSGILMDDPRDPPNLRALRLFSKPKYSSMLTWGSFS